MTSVRRDEAETKLTHEQFSQRFYLSFSAPDSSRRQSLARIERRMARRSLTEGMG